MLFDKGFRIPRQDIESSLPTKFEFGHELGKRGIFQKGYEQLKKGIEGEQHVINLLQEFGQPHWIVLQNIWLDFHGPFECDLAVLTSAGLYPFEVKHYSEHYTFHNGIWTLNGKKIGYNPVYQAIKSTVNIKNLMQLQFPNIHVQGALAFIGEHNVVEVSDQVDEIKILMHNEIRNYLFEIAKEENNSSGVKLDHEKCINWLQGFRTDNPFGLEPICLQTKEQLQKGVCCVHCGNFDLKLGRTYSSCAWGMHEPRENTIVRTIYEYGVIYFDKNLRTTDVLNFFNGQISRTNLTYYLNTHFVKMGDKRGSSYLNKGHPLHMIKDQFTLPKMSFLEF